LSTFVAGRVSVTGIGLDASRGLHDLLRHGGDVRAVAACGFLARMGAEIEILNESGETIFLSHSCPIGLLVRIDRRICGAVASFLGQATRADTRDECIYTEKLTCRFLLMGRLIP